MQIVSTKALTYHVKTFHRTQKELLKICTEKLLGHTPLCEVPLHKITVLPDPLARSKSSNKLSCSSLLQDRDPLTVVSLKKEVTISVEPTVQPSLQPREDILALTSASSLANDLLDNFDSENTFAKIPPLPGVDRNTNYQR